MTYDMGLIRVEENDYPVVELALIEGAVRIVGRGYGPMPAAHGPIRVFTPIGLPVNLYGSSSPKVVTVPVALPGDTVTVTYDINIAIDGGVLVDG